MLPDIFWAAPVYTGEEAEAVAEVLLQEPDMDEEGVGIDMLLLPPIPIAAIPLGVPLASFLPTYQVKQHQPCETRGQGPQ